MPPVPSCDMATPPTSTIASLGPSIVCAGAMVARAGTAAHKVAMSATVAVPNALARIAPTLTSGGDQSVKRQRSFGERALHFFFTSRTHGVYPHSEGVSESERADDASLV